MTETEQTMSPRQTLEAIYKEYVGKAPEASQTSLQLREAIRTTPDYQKKFATLKDEAAVLEEMVLRQLPSQDIPVWLINANHKESYKGKVKGYGALFRLPNGRNKFVDYQGAMPNAPPILTEFVFKGVGIVRDLTKSPPQDVYTWGNAKPEQAKHGATPPNSDLTRAVEQCWYYNSNRGMVSGESFDNEFAVLAVTDDEDDIQFYPPGEYNDKHELKLRAVDTAGGVFQVLADPEEVSKQLGISLDSPAKVWKHKLKGRTVAASAPLSVFLERGERFFGREGCLAEIVEQMKAHMQQKGKDEKKMELNLSHLYNKETNPLPCIQVGEKFVYRLEVDYSNPNRPYYRAYVRADQELDKKNRPMPPTLNCVVKRGYSERTKKDYAINEGAFLTVVGASERKASAFGQSLLLAE